MLVGGIGAACKVIFLSNPIKVEAQVELVVGVAIIFQCDREKYIGFR